MALSDTLCFDVSLARPGFALSMAQSLPLSGITAITGPSGSGKTTLLRVLAGLEPGAHGTVALGAQRLQGQGAFIPPHQRDIGYVFQEPRLFPHLNVADNLAFGAKRRGVGQGRIDEVVQVLDLGPLMTRDIRGLSGGEARRVALGRVLASGPRILFLDEPMTGLDASRKAEILPHIARASHTFDLPALFVSHAQDEVLTLADRVLTVAHGKITGWAAPPARLTGQVIGRSGARAMLALGRDRVPLPLAARIGETWSLALSPDGVLVSDRDPGANSALFSLKARVSACDDAFLTLDVAGQSLCWPRSAALRTVLPDTDLWLSVLNVYARPHAPTRPHRGN
ncbi:ATP-binding cassette domain-containing protein [Oceaniglobus ichthyenteri]|uniref:ATP-binding cassette domain-containing protein n=1 Tax=Oceaniglobus ichthyenteri TaxID=2136177 RepID=UPI000D346AED|nr:ATP-binding cassette domain-containing protein [Oceaniglobus ichthyenteri]